MANVAHSTLTGADLHEPKGVSSAASGAVYIANGSGSGTWGSIATSLNFVGMIADFAVPVAPAGWLECDGSAVSTTTYADLYTAVTIQQSGVRTSGNAVITGLSSTTNMKAGYYVTGSGIPAATTILSVDSGTQITLSANATSSGTSTVVVSPWGFGTGTFNLPDLKTEGRYRRSRTSSVKIGTLQDAQNLSHTHTGSATADGNHNHGAFTGSTDLTHTHTYLGPDAKVSATGSFANTVWTGNGVTATTGSPSVNLNHTHVISASGTHTHSLSVNSDGGSEARPVSIVVMTCIKY